MENFLGVVEFNGSKIYREIKLDDAILSIQDFSKLQRLQPYDSWGEKTSGIKNQFSEFSVEDIKSWATGKFILTAPKGFIRSKRKLFGV